MLIQSVNNNMGFGKIGKTGGKGLGRARKASKLLAGSNKTSKLSNSDKAQLKSAFASRKKTEDLSTFLGDFSHDFLDKVEYLQSKFVPKKS